MTFWLRYQPPLHWPSLLGFLAARCIVGRSQNRVQRLCRLRGIGPWSAQDLALRQLGATDALPLGDVALIKALRVLEGPEVKLADRALAWRPWRAYAAQHLWASLT